MHELQGKHVVKPNTSHGFKCIGAGRGSEDTVRRRNYSHTCARVINLEHDRNGLSVINEPSQPEFQSLMPIAMLKSSSN